MPSAIQITRSTEARLRSGSSLKIALALTASYMLAEVVGGILTGSLALLADAGHMCIDAVVLGMGLFAWVVSERSPTQQKTFGYYRVEILVALANGIVLWGLVFFIVREALHRLHEPSQVKGFPMMLIAAVGLGVNIYNAMNLSKTRHFNLNIRSAYLNVVADALGSVGALTAGLVIAWTGWTLADPLASLFIAVLILYSSWGLIRETVNILMEGTPSHLDLGKVKSDLEMVKGVERVHDLHVWTLTTGVYSLSAHVVIEKGEDAARLLEELEKTLSGEFSIRHTTLQLEFPDRSPCLPDSF